MRGFALLLAVSAGAALAFAAPARAGVVWSENFDGMANGSHPVTDYPGGATGNDWTYVVGDGYTSEISTAVGNPGPSLFNNDTSTQGFATHTVAFNQFAPFDMTQAGQERLVVSFDMRVDSLLSGDGSPSAPRFYLQNGNVTNNMGKGVVIGLGRAQIDGASHVFWYVGDQLNAAAGQPPSSAVPGADTAIGYTGSGWAPGFDFGITNHNPDQNNSHDEFYHFELVITAGSDTFTGTATRISTGDTVSFERTLKAPLAFSNNSADKMVLQGGGSAESQAYYDNINFSVSAVPEPTGLSLMGLGSLALLKRHRRKR